MPPWHIGDTDSFDKERALLKPLLPVDELAELAAAAEDAAMAPP